MAITNGYCTRQELENYLLAQDFSGTQHDNDLDAAVNASSRAIDTFCGGDLENRFFYDSGSATAKEFYPQSSRRVFVPDFSTTTGLVVKTDLGDDGTYETTVSSANYQVEPLNADDAVFPFTAIRMVEGDTFPTSSHRPPVQVTAQWGWAAVPDAIKQACLQLSAYYFRLREAPLGVAGFGDFGVVRVRELPVVDALLRPYRKATSPRTSLERFGAGIAGLVG